MSEPTPGPWRFERNVWNTAADKGIRSHSIGSIRGPLGGDDWFIASLENAPEQEANAVLLAAAWETARERDRLKAEVERLNRIIRGKTFPSDDPVRDRYKKALEDIVEKGQGPEPFFQLLLIKIARAALKEE